MQGSEFSAGLAELVGVVGKAAFGRPCHPAPSKGNQVVQRRVQGQGQGFQVVRMAGVHGSTSWW